jgi:hypothetical protein
MKTILVIIILMLILNSCEFPEPTLINDFKPQYINKDSIKNDSLKISNYEKIKIK